MMPSDPPNDGVPAEFIRLLTSSQRKLFAFILSLVRHSSDADDLLQETNMVMWRKWRDFEMGTSFDAWAFTIARFQVMAYRKKQQRSKLHFDDELVELMADDASEILDSDHDPRRVALGHCLKKLKDDQRRLIAERYEPGGSVNHMAAQQGRSPKAVSEALRRIRRSLMICIEKTLEEEDPTFA
ncbi:MAG: sigma-70 family RNA polymerase sigma factor [Verrucomicrobiota bacterium]